MSANRPPIRVHEHWEYPDASDIPDGGWGIVRGRFLCRPPGTPRALPLGAHRISFNAEHTGSVTVEPSINYDPGGPWEWHGWLRASEWVPA